jgi:hypothetical protein
MVGKGEKLEEVCMDEICKVPLLVRAHKELPRRVDQ